MAVLAKRTARARVLRHTVKCVLSLLLSALSNDSNGNGQVLYQSIPYTEAFSFGIVSDAYYTTQFILTDGVSCNIIAVVWSTLKRL